MRIRTFIALALLCGAASAQIEEQDLALDGPTIPPEVETMFEDAVARFATTEQPDTIPLFSQIIEVLEPLASSGDPEVLDRLERSLSYRALANFNFGDTEAVELDLTRSAGARSRLRHRPRERGAAVCLHLRHHPGGDGRCGGAAARSG